jgi:acyl-CoA reductase-like NAD-dependent aldehyde dehydrogenase
MSLTYESSLQLAKRLGAVNTYGHFINGEWVDGHSGKQIELWNPANRQILAHIQAGDAIDVDAAVEAAADAFPVWSRTSPLYRQEVLRQIAAKLRERHLDYAMLETLNNGKPISEAYGHDINGAIAQFEYFAGAAFHIAGSLEDFKDSTLLLHREAIGPVAQIIPWNVALLMASMKLAPALAAGCTVVLKPAESVCLSVLEFVKDIADIVPRGVINVVTGYGADIGQSLVGHPKIRKVAFTGSRETARKVMTYAAQNIIPQTFELGGKSANIVCADADIAAAAASVVHSTIVNKGEVCLAGTRVFVQQAVHDEFLEQLAKQMTRVRQGDPLDPETNLGAQASQAQFDKVMSYIELGVSEGATVHAGGVRAHVPGLEDGFFIEPTIFTDVRNDMRIAQEEIFGPVTDILVWNDEDDMLREVNDSDYGLGGGLWTADLTRAHRISRQMETGTIWVNRYYNSTFGQSVGGYKQSGFGREGSIEAMLNHYTVTKNVVINLAPAGQRIGFRKP